ncbi:MAG: DnaB helicase C-terminal domain-containing protein [Gemmatimonadota bacterium]|nr:DnaB helicase C-terminal domain-containing protein [Gemmatimonadota bacterium]
MRPADISPLSQLMQRMDATADGAPPQDSVPSGFPSLDELLGGGFRRGDLVVLGGDVGAGKSALALAIALRVRQGGRTSAFYTSEMSPARVLERVLAMEGRARIDDIRNGSLDDSGRAGIGAAALRLRQQLPVIEALPAGGGTAARMLQSALDVELAVVDSLQALASGSRDQEEELADAIRQLKATAIESGVAVLLTAHLPLLGPERKGARPTLDDFGALGAVKQHADVVLALYREEMYETAADAQGATELAILKNRNGPTSYIDLYFYKQWLRFEDMVEPNR